MCIRDSSSGEPLSIAVGYGYDYNEAAEFQGRVAALLDELGIPPVSYTHLDVYKRQRFAHAARKTWR